MTTETIRAYMNEAASLQKEINTITKKKRELNKRKKELDKLPRSEIDRILEKIRRINLFGGPGTGIC